MLRAWSTVIITPWSHTGLRRAQGLLRDSSPPASLLFQVSALHDATFGAGSRDPEASDGYSALPDTPTNPLIKHGAWVTIRAAAEGTITAIDNERRCVDSGRQFQFGRLLGRLLSLRIARLCACCLVWHIFFNQRLCRGWLAGHRGWIGSLHTRSASLPSDRSVRPLSTHQPRAPRALSLCFRLLRPSRPSSSESERSGRFSASISRHASLSAAEYGRR